MIKINSKRGIVKGSAGKLKQSISQSKGSVSFESIMMDMQNRDKKRQLNEMIEDIEKYGKELKQKPDIRTFERYKGAIKRFLQSVVNGAYRVVKNVVGIRRQRIEITLKEIDKKLIELSNAILKKEAKNLEIAAKIDDIRGLIINITGE